MGWHGQWNNGTRAGILALIRTHWFLNPCQHVLTKPEFSAPYALGDFAAHRVLRTICGFPQRYQFQFDARHVFFHEGWVTPIHLGCGFQFPAQFVARPVCSWRDPLDPKVGSAGGHSRGCRATHTCRTGRGQKPDIIDYFLVSTNTDPASETKTCSLEPTPRCADHAQH